MKHVYNPSRLRTLVVDDHDLMRKSITKILQKHGIIEIIECPNGHEAKNLIEEQQFDLIICDIYLGNTKGFDILELVRGQDLGSDVPFLVVSGEANKDEIVRSVDLGANDYILKPFQTEEFLKKIETILALHHSPNEVLKAIRGAEELMSAGDLQGAFKLAKKSLELKPDSPRANHTLALVLEMLGQFEPAIMVLLKNIAKNPSYHRSYRSLANIYLKQNRPQEVIDVIKKELELNPKQPVRQVQLAHLLFKASEHEEALQRYRQALLLDSKNDEALMGTGACYIALGNTEKAIHYFKKHRRNHPNSSRSLKAIVKCALDAGKPRLAEIALRDEKKMNPKRMDTYVVLAKLMFSLEKYQESLDVMDDCLLRDRDNYEALAIKGSILVKLEKYEDALAVYQKLGTERPTLQSLFSLSELLIRLKRYPQALLYLHKSLRYKQKKERTYYLIGLAHNKTQQYGKEYFSLLKSTRMVKSKIAEESLKASKSAIEIRRKQQQARGPKAS